MSGKRRPRSSTWKSSETRGSKSLMNLSSQKDDACIGGGERSSLREKSSISSPHHEYRKNRKPQQSPHHQHFESGRPFHSPHHDNYPSHRPQQRPHPEYYEDERRFPSPHQEYDTNRRFRQPPPPDYEDERRFLTPHQEYDRNWRFQQSPPPDYGGERRFPTPHQEYNRNWRFQQPPFPDYDGERRFLTPHQEYDRNRRFQQPPPPDYEDERRFPTPHQEYDRNRRFQHLPYRDYEIEMSLTLNHHQYHENRRPQLSHYPEHDEDSRYWHSFRKENCEDQRPFQSFDNTQGPDHYNNPHLEYHYPRHPNRSQDNKRGRPVYYKDRNHRKIEKELRPVDLVKALVEFTGQSATVNILGQKLKRNPEEVAKAANSHGDVFSMVKLKESELIELVPKIVLCTNYLSKTGCLSKDSCKDLHICKYFVLKTCEKGSLCWYGHNWDTDHNQACLSRFYLDIDKEKIHEVVEKVCKSALKPTVCSFYNGKQGCKKVDNCGHLHICRDYLKGAGNCTFKNCRFNHKITSPQCARVLKHHGIDDNESPRDILINLLSLLKMKDASASSAKSNCEAPENDDMDAMKMKSEDLLEYDGKDKRSDLVYTLSNEDTKSNSSNENNDYESYAKGDRLKEMTKEIQCTKKIDKPFRTCKSTDVFGDVKIPEICLYNLEGNCSKEQSGCDYLHSKSLYHWQVELNTTWYNFRVFQSVALEKAYLDVARNKVKVPPLDSDKVKSYNKLFDTFGTAWLVADFKTMKVTFTQSNACEESVLNIRRISTCSAALSDSSKATIYNWYFKNDSGNWIEYGQVNDYSQDRFLGDMKSKEIEEKYVTNPLATIIVNISGTDYEVNFSNMTQTNVITNTVVEVRRRPSKRREPCLRKDDLEDDTSVFPSHWSCIPNQTLVKLNSSDKEYQDLAVDLRRTQPTLKIIEIQRLQNWFALQAFNTKKMELEQRYDDKLNVQRLFHGVDPSRIKSLCFENLDWRQKQEVNEMEVYGKGIYFFTSVVTAHKHCSRDNVGQFFMVVAQVNIGSIVQGTKDLKRPPVNPSTDELYDTTVDSVSEPKIFVKYDKDEYYPEYIVEYSMQS